MPMPQDEYAEGRLAYLAELPRDECPYPAQSSMGKQWLAGWYHQSEYDVEHN